MSIQVLLAGKTNLNKNKLTLQDLNISASVTRSQTHTYNKWSYNITSVIRNQTNINITK